MLANAVVNISVIFNIMQFLFVTRMLMVWGAPSSWGWYTEDWFPWGWFMFLLFVLVAPITSIVALVASFSNDGSREPGTAELAYKALRAKLKKAVDE